MASSERQGGLRGPVVCTAEEAPHGESQSHGQVIGLIESAPELAPKMERHRYHRIRISQHLHTLHAHLR